MQTNTLERSSSSSAAVLSDNIVTSLANAKQEKEPFRFWYFKDILPPAVCKYIIALPLSPVPVGDTFGKRETHNKVRRFFSPDLMAKYPVVNDVAAAFQGSEVVRSIEKLCNINLNGSFLRIEYCQDRDGFWLEPHMDIKEKFITLQVYLNDGKDAATLGTDLYDKEKKYHSTAPSLIGDAMLFIPKEPNSWHGFERRPIADVRRSLIINYVMDNWRSVHELSYPDQKIV